MCYILLFQLFNNWNRVVIPALRVCLIHPSPIRLSTFPVSHHEDSGDGETETRSCLHIQKLWDFNMSTRRRSMPVALLACKMFALSALKADGASLRCITVSSCKHPHTPSNYQNIMQQKSYRILLMLCRKIEKKTFKKSHKLHFKRFGWLLCHYCGPAWLLFLFSWVTQQHCASSDCTIRTNTSSSCFFLTSAIPATTLLFYASHYSRSLNCTWFYFLVL